MTDFLPQHPAVVQPTDKEIQELVKKHRVQEDEFKRELEREIPADVQACAYFKRALETDTQAARLGVGIATLEHLLAMLALNGDDKYTFEMIPVRTVRRMIEQDLYEFRKQKQKLTRDWMLLVQLSEIDTPERFLKDGNDIQTVLEATFACGPSRAKELAETAARADQEADANIDEYIATHPSQVKNAADLGQTMRYFVKRALLESDAEHASHYAMLDPLFTSYAHKYVAEHSPPAKDDEQADDEDEEGEYIST